MQTKLDYFEKLELEKTAKLKDELDAAMESEEMSQREKEDRRAKIDAVVANDRRAGNKDLNNKISTSFKALPAPLKCSKAKAFYKSAHDKQL